MTTIATNGTTIAADGQLTMYERVACTDQKKIFKLSDGSFVGICGNVSLVEDFVQWLDDPTQPKPTGEQEISALLIGRSSHVQFITGNGNITEVRGPAAIGTGEAFAIAAMKAGASPKRAVEIACDLDIYSSGTITEHTIK